jgi:hydrogenase-4 transcriptional activator
VCQVTSLFLVCFRNRCVEVGLVMQVQKALLKLWKASCSHIHLEDSARDIEVALREVLSFERMLLRIVDVAHHQVYTVAEQPLKLPQNDHKKSLSKSQMGRMLRWSRSDQVLLSGRSSGGAPAALLPESIDQNTLAVPLCHSSIHAGLLLVGYPARPLSQGDIETIRLLAEPIAVAVSNHFQLHELASLREAAEAERGALLRRLGRTDLGEQIIGEASGLRTVMERVDLVASSDAPVMILGETGSGKELIARALHTRGSRSSGPFIRVNCGAIPSELVDSQLFGHEKGAFTGADQTRRGWFERADGGTLFLDEIGELPLEAQVRFLRVLQDGFVERVGSDAPVHVDVRVVAATHRDLAQMVSEGKFREDLWYRVAVFPILLPPLRERIDDIPELAAHFAERAAMRFGLSPVVPASEDISLLQSYRWPGNIRELGAVIDRAAILGNGKSLEIALALGLNKSVPKTAVDDGSADFSPKPHPSTSASIGRDSSEEFEDLSIDFVMRRHIERVLQKTLGKVEGPGGAAEILKINPHTLRARMRKLGIQWNRFRRCP